MAAKLRAAQSNGRKGAARGLSLATEHGLGVAKSRAPHEDGDLERSGVAQVDEANLRGFMSFDTPYAVVQHEDLTLQHDAGRQAKYLESALHGEAQTFRQLIGRSVSTELGA